MDPRSLSDLAALTGAAIVGDPDAAIGRDVVIDSRRVTPGALFVAIKGERVDGHDFVEVAAAEGAGAVMGERLLDTSLPQLVVADAVKGLSSLARGIVAEARANGLRTIGITGSAGKTSTKDLIAHVVETAGATVSPVGSFNNEIGVPLTAAAITRETQFLVSEMGARGSGHIAWLCSIVPPDVAVVINVGHAHVGEFGSVAAIAQAKGELIEATASEGWAVLNDDDPLVSDMAARTSARIARFAVGRPPVGTCQRAVWATNIASQDERYAFDLHIDQTQAPVQLQVVGAHQVPNALAAASVGAVLGLSIFAIAAALNDARPRSRWRMEVAEGPGGLLVVNDAYNANPDSMAAALRTLAGLRRPSGRLVAVLGDMLELGDGAAGDHEAVGRLAAVLGVDDLIAVGAHAADLARGFGANAIQVADAGAALDAAKARSGPRAVVLVKASRGVALETVAMRLLESRGDAQ